MYTVTVENQCGCFKKSEFKPEKTFDNQQDAYQYAKILEELMAEEFCGKHIFVAQRVSDNHFILNGVANPNSGGCGTGSCGTGSCDTGACDTDIDNAPVSGGCGTGCGCH
jgi:hypothetical protein